MTYPSTPRSSATATVAGEAIETATLSADEIANHTTNARTTAAAMIAKKAVRTVRTVRFG